MKQSEEWLPLGKWGQGPTGKVHEGTTDLTVVFPTILLGLNNTGIYICQNSFNSTFEIYVFNCIHILLLKERKWK